MANMMQPPISHYLLTADQSRSADRLTIEETGISGFTLMEVAGSSAAKHLLNQDPHFTHGLYLCGKGNNAGDALVAARYLSLHDIAATVVFLSGADDLSADAQKNISLLHKFAGDNLQVVTAWEDFELSGDYDFIVDGMLGTGLKNNLRGDYKKAVEWANKQPVPIFSMDIPTGLHADSGQMMETSINAAHTFAFGGRKQGYYLGEGPDCTGSVVYCELPFPNKYKKECQSYLIDESWIESQTPSPGRHEYDAGVLYIAAGSEGLTGAAILAARSAWAGGLGGVVLICPRGLLPIYEQTLPSVIKKPVGKRSDLFFTEKHVPAALDILSQKDGNVLFGPGLGRSEETIRFTHGFLSPNPLPAVIDADGLWGLAQSSSWQKPDGVSWTLTPHPGELARLAKGAPASDFERLAYTRKLSRQKKITILSKGMPGIIGTLSGKCYITNYDTRYFSRAGSGDVLAGKVSALQTLGHNSNISCALALLKGKR